VFCSVTVPVNSPATHHSQFLLTFNSFFALLAEGTCLILFRSRSASCSLCLSSPCPHSWQLPWTCFKLVPVLWTDLQISLLYKCTEAHSCIFAVSRLPAVSVPFPRGFRTVPVPLPQQLEQPRCLAYFTATLAQGIKNNSNSSSSSSYIATDGHSAISSWCRAPFGAGDQMLHFFEWQLLFKFSCRTPSLTRGLVCDLQCNDASSISSHIATDGLSASSSWCRAPFNFFVWLLLPFFSV
jgi:hypothetical protein